VSFTISQSLSLGLAARFDDWPVPVCVRKNMGCRRIGAVIAIVLRIYMSVIMCPLSFWRYRVAFSYYHPVSLDINSSYKALVFGHDLY